jgi:ABC-type sulfate/molybdate transport systems ATPase subunit
LREHFGTVLQHEVVDVVLGEAIVGVVMLNDQSEFALEFVHDFVVTSQGELVTARNDFELWKETLDVLEMSIVDAVNFSRIKAFNADLTLT